jgi:hypothetical protein
MWEKSQKKTIFTLNLNGYAPEITDLTYPLIEAYARKIGAEFHIITERKFPEWPLTYEKFQIYELAQQMNNDWNIYIDSDALVHPDTPDVTLILPRDTVAHFGKDFSPVRWKEDRFFRRDGRHIGSGNWLAVGSDLCIDLWKPLDDLTPQEAIANINPTVAERRSAIIERSHLIDDYVCSRNIAKYGLKCQTLKDVLAGHGFKDGGGFFYHHYLFTVPQKVIELKKVLRGWGIVELMGYQFEETPIDCAEKIKGWMSRPELEWLYEKAKDMASVAAFGNFMGRSTYALCAATGNGGGPEFTGRVYAVDPFVFSGAWIKGIDPALGLKEGEDFIQEFLRNVGHFPNLSVFKATSLDAAQEPMIPQQVEMSFFDDDHTYEALMANLKAWAHRTTKLISGHDFDDPNYPGVKQAVYEFFGADRVARGPGSIWYIQ